MKAFLPIVDATFFLKAGLVRRFAESAPFEIRLYNPPGLDLFDWQSYDCMEFATIAYQTIFAQASEGDAICFSLLSMEDYLSFVTAHRALPNESRSCRTKTAGFWSILQAQHAFSNLPNGM